MSESKSEIEMRSEVDISEADYMAHTPYGNQYQQNSPYGPQAQQWSPPPQQGPNFIYDPMNVQVKPMTITNWSQIQNDETQYSYLWSANNFTPEKFAEIQKTYKCTDLCFAITWVINLIIFVGFTIYLISKTGVTNLISSVYDVLHISDISSPSGSDSMFDKLVSSFYIPPLISFAFIVGHIIYIALIPKFYVHFGLFIGPVVLSILSCVVIAFTRGYIQIVFSVILGLVVIITICCYCCFKNLINFTAQVMKFTARNLIKHPAVFLMSILQIALDAVVWLVFIIGVFLMPFAGWPSYYYAIYVYYLFAMYWIQNTIHLVFFSVTANLSSCIFFLDGTEYQMRFPLIHALKKCFLTLGSSAFAGLIATFLDFLERIANKAIKKLPCRGFCCCCCIVVCLINCIVKCIGQITKYGLVYVAIYSISFMEGCRRFTEVSAKKFLDSFISQAITDRAIKWNNFLFYILGIVCSILAASDAAEYLVSVYGMSQLSSEYDIYIYIGGEDGTVHFPFCIFILYILYFIFSIVGTAILSAVFTAPFNTFSFTTFVCFSEFPDRLKQLDYEIYEAFVLQYQQGTTNAANANQQVVYQQNIVINNYNIPPNQMNMPLIQ